MWFAEDIIAGSEYQFKGIFGKQPVDALCHHGWGIADIADHAGANPFAFSCTCPAVVSCIYPPYAKYSFLFSDDLHPIRKIAYYKRAGIGKLQVLF